MFQRVFYLTSVIVDDLVFNIYCIEFQNLVNAVAHLFFYCPEDPNVVRWDDGCLRADSNAQENNRYKC
jgi:hypothetical protein